MMYIQRSGNKLHAKSTEYGGHVYHSKLEAAYAAELDIRVMAKDIKSWERQVKLDLRVNDMHIAHYYIDFIIHHNDGSREYVECKGFEMGEWKLKWRLFEALFDTDFRKHPDDRMTVIKQSQVRMR